MLHFRIAIIINHFNTWIFSTAEFCEIQISVLSHFLDLKTGFVGFTESNFKEDKVCLLKLLPKR